MKHYSGQVLDLPDHGVKLKHDARGTTVFDPVRRRWVLLTPEEWVRQHVINLLLVDTLCPIAMVGVEVPLSLNGLAKRADVVVHGGGGRPILLVECKAPGVPVSQRTFEQAARYNSVFQVPYLLVTNGMKHFCCAVDHERGTVDFLTALPSYAIMNACGRP